MKSPIRAIQKVIRGKEFRAVDEDFILPNNDPIQAKGELIDKEVFNGGPIDSFSEIGRLYLITLLKIGLHPGSKVLDVGCGALRGGYWIINFLSPNNYYGIEPNVEMLNVGKRVMLGEELLEEKKPSFDHNSDFDFSVFNSKFDFVVARSIWSHTSKSQIQKMLDSFVDNSNPDGVFLTSYLRPFSSKDDYKGSDWVGKSHESNEVGIVFHSFSWIESECQKRNLKVQELKFDFYSQIWLHISKFK